MNPILVATHDEGVVRVYYRQADGVLTQTARFLAPAVEPPALAALVADLSDTLHWNGGTPTPVPPSVIPIGKGKTAPKKKNDDFRKRRRAGRAEIEQRRANVMTHLTARGEPATAMEVGASVFSKLPDPIGKARKILDQLAGLGLVTRIPLSDPVRYKATQ